MFDRYVGIPYVDKGRDLNGCDCWGLVRLPFHDLLGIELPSFDGLYSLPADRKAIAALIAGKMEPWEEVAPGFEQCLNVVLMRENDHARHIGVVTRPGRLLHVERGFTSCIEPYRTGMLRHRVVGFYRHRDHA